MTRTALLISFILTFIMGSSKVTQPDFAFPKTVAKDARADLKKADKDHDAHTALNALIRIAVAESSIDAGTLPAEIKLVEETSGKYTSDPLYGLFQALLAKLYQCYYAADSWKYDQRELPASPYPADISEWSGEQFKTKIKSLALSSVTGKSAESLNGLAIADYADLVTTGELTTTYYPTLLDFCYRNAIDVVDNEDSDREIALKAYGNSPEGSAPRVMWGWECRPQYDRDFEKIYRLAQEYSGNRYAGLIVTNLADYVDSDNIDQVKAYVDLATGFLDKFAGTPFKESIRGNIRQLENPRVDLRVGTLCRPGEPLKVDVTSTNAQKIKVNVYYAGDEPIKPRTRGLYEALRTRTPQHTLTIDLKEAVPFRTDTTVEVVMDRPGYYYILPVFGDKKIESYQVNRVRCVPIYPMGIEASGRADVITVDPATGRPMADAAITLTPAWQRTNAPAATYCGTTDADGVVPVWDKMKDDTRYYVTATTGGKKYKFEDVTLYRQGRGRPDERYHAEILTDRLLYHPGDEAQVLVVVTKASPGTDDKMQQSFADGRNVDIILYDANYQAIDTISARTDDWGRATAACHLPADGLTGNFMLQVTAPSGNDIIGNHRIMVSDYKMPDFEIKIDETACDVPEKGRVTIKGTATSYSGMPMADATVTLNLSESSWGWWRWHNRGKKIYSEEKLTDRDGKFTFVLTDSVLTDRKKLYAATLDAVSATGSTATASTSFALTKKYDISVNLPSYAVDGEKPLRPDVKVYAPDGTTVDIPLEWALAHDNDTTAFRPLREEIDLRDLKPAGYILIIRSTDAELAEEKRVGFTLYNVSTGIVPDDQTLWIPKSAYTAGADGEAEVMFANAHADTYIYCYITNDDTTAPPMVMQSAKGYHTFRLKMAPGAGTTKLNMYAVRDGKLHPAEITLTRGREEGLKITGESFRDRLTPGAEETWKIRITDAAGTGCRSALVLDMYNQALNAIMPQTQSLAFPTYSTTARLDVNFESSYNSRYTYTQQLTGKFRKMGIQSPQFNFYGMYPGMTQRVYYSSVKDECMDESCDGVVAEAAAPKAAPQVMVRGAMSMGAVKNAKMMDMAAEVEAEATADTGAGDAPQMEAESFDYRDSDIPLALWAPTLTTDNDGEISYTFTVPEANTTWRLQAIAWSRNMEVGSMMRDFVASKPVMVQPNLPRFLRNGDEASVVASVMNNTDSLQQVTTTVEIFDPLSGDVLRTKTFTSAIEAKGYEKVRVRIDVDTDIAAIGYRVRATNGDFSDGEQAVIRVLASEQEIVETTPFYLNPGENLYTTTLPSDEGARISLTFCENPAWTIVTALPGLRTEIADYANSAGAALYSAAISRGIVSANPRIGQVLKAWLDNPGDSALISMLEKNDDLKIAVLNATPWVLAAQTQNDRMANLAMIFDADANARTIATAVKTLGDLQNPDGGWAWAKWCKESSMWATSNVLAMLGDLRRDGWLPGDKALTDMVDKAVRYYDANVKDTDLLYCLVRPLFSAEVSANGRRVIAATLKDIRRHWKTYADPAYKAMAAKALFLNGDKSTAGELMKSLSEFGVYTKDQGLKFPNVNSLYNYAILLDAYATIQPGSREVDGLRQQLIVRKQGTDWGSSVVTMEVVKAILSSGSTWTVEATEAEISAGSHRIAPEGAVEKATGTLRADLSAYGGESLTVKTSGSGPAYGAVYTQSTRTMSDVDAHGCDDLDIEKHLFVRRGTEWTAADSLAVGDRVKVQLTIHCRRNLQYVAIVDQRPAAFQPVEQLPGWMWSEGVGFYRENLDSQTDLHVVYMAPGTYLLSYEMNVGFGGTFSSGVASIQSLYAPELSAHSSGSTLRIKE